MLCFLLAVVVPSGVYAGEAAAQGTSFSLENRITRNATQADIIAAAGEPDPAYTGESDVLIIYINDARLMDLSAVDGDEARDAKAPAFHMRGLLYSISFAALDCNGR